MSWPVPQGLHFGSAAPAQAGREVAVSLLDGQRVHGTLAQDADLSASAQICLECFGQSVVLPLAHVRSVACRHALLAPDPHTGLLAFHALFIDGEILDGFTHGYVNRQTAGVYLFVQQSAAHYQPLWIPRHALQSIRLNKVDAVAPPPLPTELPAQRSTPVVPGAPTRVLAHTMVELAVQLEASRGKPMVAAAQSLLELGLIDHATFEHLQADKSGRLRSYIDERLASNEGFRLDLEHARAYMVKTPEVDAENFLIEEQALQRLPWAVAVAQQVVPLGFLGTTLYVASAMPMSRELEDRLNVLAGGRLALVWADAGQIRARLARESGNGGQAAGSAAQSRAAAGAVGAQDLQALLTSAQHEIKVEGAEARDNDIDERSSVVQLVKRIITDAYLQKASDIHIETNPGAEHSRVRLRKDGDLEEYIKLPGDLRAALVSRIKVMSKLDIAERRRPQDGKINFADFSDIKLELRVAILPTHDNLEDVVMRLLAASKPIPLAQLGFAERDEQMVKVLAHRPYGLILACGPTGSGKTTTLHSLLHEINTEDRKIWTAEDPIEITQSGLRQLQVNPKIGVTFASAMRAFLRADPDVIMIGEIRDEETARIAIEASLTGHLVLSTLHTNSAAESVVRLLDLGMDPMNFADSLLGIVAQRLVRALCKKCKVAQPLEPAAWDQYVQEYVHGTDLSPAQAQQRLLQAAGVQGVQDLHGYHAPGCPACSGKGYKGRMGIYETLQTSPELKHLIQTRAPTSKIFAHAMASGARSLRQDALEKVCAGLIDHPQAATVFA